jgi:enoyl-CoA hydratase
MTIDYSRYKALKINHLTPRILEVVISNPGKLNALDSTGHREIAEIWRDVDADPDVSCVLLRGDSGNYSAGGDLGMIEDMTNDWSARSRIWREARDLVYNIINCSKPIVAAIEGPAVGAGLSAAMVSDVIVVGRKSRIIDGHTRLGVAAGDHAAIIWPLLCGMAKAKYYLLLCDTITGEEAERIGLASLCVDDDKVIETARGVCERLAQQSPSAVRWTKYALNNWLRAAGPIFDVSLGLEFMGFSGPDAKEGVTALKEKRKPRFATNSPV